MMTNLALVLGQYRGNRQKAYVLKLGSDTPIRPIDKKFILMITSITLR